MNYQDSVPKSEPVSDTLAQPWPNTRQRILMVDDEPDLRRLNQEVLACSGYHVDAAEDGEAAWDLLQRHRYDLVVTDQNMPKVSGIELLEKLHAGKLDVPVILATGVLPEAELERHPWLAIKAVLLKPYSFDELLATVKNVLHTFAHERQQVAPPPNWQAQPLRNGLQR